MRAGFGNCYSDTDAIVVVGAGVLVPLDLAAEDFPLGMVVGGDSGGCPKENEGSSAPKIQDYTAKLVPFVPSFGNRGFAKRTLGLSILRN